MSVVYYLFDSASAAGVCSRRLICPNVFTTPQPLSELSTVCREVMGLVSMLFEWYKVTATLPNDKSGAKVTNERSPSGHVTSCPPITGREDQVGLPP